MRTKAKKHLTANILTVINCLLSHQVMGPVKTLQYWLTDSTLLSQTVDRSSICVFSRLSAKSTSLQVMSNTEDNAKIEKFNERRSNNYSLRALRAENALKTKGFCKALKDDKCSQDTKEKTSAMLAVALGGTAQRVYLTQVSDPVQMPDILDSCFASSRTATRISVLTWTYTKRFSSTEDEMSHCFGDFESLFAQLERMEQNTRIPDSHKALSLLAGMGSDSALQSTAAALRTRNTEKLTWECVTADLR